jgi:hypothetical protein
MTDYIKHVPFEILKLMVIDFTYKDLIAIESTNKYLKNFIFKTPDLFHWKLTPLPCFQKRPVISELDYLYKYYRNVRFIVDDNQIKIMVRRRTETLKLKNTHQYL